MTFAVTAVSLGSPMLAFVAITLATMAAQTAKPLALSAIDIALWDLKAKRAGQSLARDNTVLVPDRPGLGIELDENAVRKFEIAR